MNTGHVISGVGHIGLIGWMFLGGFINPQPTPFEVTEVAVISGAEFQAMIDARQAPAEITETAQPAAPVVTPDAPEVDAAPEPAEPETPPPVPEVAEETPQEPPTPEETPVPEVSEVAPEAPEPPAEVTVETPEVAERPVERPADRIAPTPAPAPEEDVRPSETAEPAVTPEDTGETVEPPREAAVVPEATDRTVTEADESPKAAVTASRRPPARRPEPPAPRRVAETPTPAAPTESDTDAAVQAALDSALSSATADVPTGPPLSSGEKDALRLAVQGCWVVDPGAQSAGVTVTIAMSMEQNGTVVQSSLRMIGSEGGDAGAVDAAFQSARRAILRCQKGGYDLPADKYGQWQEIEMTFNPERMRIR